MENPLTESEKTFIDSVELRHSKAKQFLHCKNCLDQFLGSKLNDSMTPRDYGMYEVSTYDFPYPGGKKVEVVVVWCKRCGHRVWDSRMLTPLA